VSDSVEDTSDQAAETASPETPSGAATAEQTPPTSLAELRQSPQQGEMPFAVVLGQAMTEIPKDLYIPPRALEVFLEAFEGPLDLLLYLIRRQNIDILEIDVSDITDQYMQYVELMDAMQFELAAEYLLMAAMLAEIKSRMLLPRSESVEEDEEDPRAQLIRRLQEYERFKQAAEEIDELPRMEREVFPASAEPPDIQRSRPDPDVDMRELLVALTEVLRRAEMYEHHHIQREALSTRERMSDVLDSLKQKQFVPFVSLFRVEEGRLGVVVTFLAIMELIKESLVEIVQTDNFGPIHVKARADSAVDGDQPPPDSAANDPEATAAAPGDNSKPLDDESEDKA
jgi:segregation and condensation protein A